MALPSDRQTETDRHRQRRTDRHGQTETDRQRQTDTDRQRQTEKQQTDSNTQPQHQLFQVHGSEAYIFRMKG